MSSFCWRRLAKRTDFMFVEGEFNMAFITFVKMTQDMLVIVWRTNGFFLAGAHFFCADIHGDVERGAPGFFDGFLQGRTFFGAGGVAEDGFVFGYGYTIESF